MSRQTIRPTNTLVEARLVAGRLVEIEADAIVGSGRDKTEVSESVPVARSQR
jgi:hypothetical protein